MKAVFGLRPRKTLHSFCRRSSSLAQTHLQPPLSQIKLDVVRADPFSLVAPQLDLLRERLLDLLGSSHPSLSHIAQYYFLQPSKQLRPLLILLFSRATNGLGRGWERKLWASECEGARGMTEELDSPLTRAEILTDWNPRMPDHSASFESAFSVHPPGPPPPPLPSAPPILSEAHVLPSVLPECILPTQIRLAQIAEMIHVASLLHDDVVDNSPLRRGVPSAPAEFGNKLTVLGGDFLLARASAALSRLGEYEVVELVASVIANLVEGEIMQVKEVHSPDQFEPTGQGESRVSRERWNIYLKKSYLKTASLMAKTARGAVVLGGTQEGEIWKDVAYAYGRNLGIAFQLVDDMLDFAVGESMLGKPAGGADLRLGLSTAPVLYAWEENQDMGPLIKRRFEGEGDVETAREIVRKSRGLERTRDLARVHAEKAREVLGFLPDSEAKAALQVLTEKVVERKR